MGEENAAWSVAVLAMVSSLVHVAACVALTDDDCGPACDRKEVRVCGTNNGGSSRHGEEDTLRMDEKLHGGERTETEEGMRPKEQEKENDKVSTLT